MLLLLWSLQIRVHHQSIYKDWRISQETLLQIIATNIKAITIQIRKKLDFFISSFNCCLCEVTKCPRHVGMMRTSEMITSYVWSSSVLVRLISDKWVVRWDSCTDSTALAQYVPSVKKVTLGNKEVNECIWTKVCQVDYVHLDATLQVKRARFKRVKGILCVDPKLLAG